MSSQDSKPTPSDQLASLKDLVAKLQSKVERLESTLATDVQAVGTSLKSAVGLAPGQTLRLVLMGPPGAGELYFLSSCSNYSNPISWSSLLTLRRKTSPVQCSQLVIKSVQIRLSSVGKRFDERDDGEEE
jgi:hypothetical protein